ncbi:MAG: SpoIIIAH-like family protein [Oscillospiraceae bacterium]|nr:SpoIIIAH-like family protein [Oscillospiraceae bacterium]
MKMTNWKKNCVAAGVLITVCASIYVNWLYSGGEAANLVDTLDAQKVMSDDLLILGGGSVQVGGTETDTVTNYFAAVRLSRQQARDSAVSLLQEAMSYGDATEITTSSAQLEELIQTSLCEAQIESLVVAKGYADCVAYMNEEGISIAVASPEGGLKEQDVALIADIVMSQSAHTMGDIRVVEVP